jgi:hypothetical protein
MPKRVFWPLTLVIMGLIFLASNLRLLPASFWNLWPLILIVVGLGGLLTSDRDEWMDNSSMRKAAPAKKAAKSSKKVAAKAKSRRAR